MAPPEPSVWERRWKSWSPHGSVCHSHQSQNFPDVANTNKVGVVGVCPKCHRGVCRVSFRKICCKFPKLAVCNQPLYRTPEKEGGILALCFANESNALRQLFRCFGSGGNSRNEAKPKPVLYSRQLHICRLPCPSLCWITIYITPGRSHPWCLRRRLSDVIWLSLPPIIFS